MQNDSALVSFVRYNRWANQRLINWLNSLRRDLLVMETTSSFPSIYSTTQHLAHAYFFWWVVLTDGDIWKINDKDYKNDIDAVFNDILAMSKQMEQIFCAWSDEDWEKKVSNTDGPQRRSDFVMHMISHGNYHRGQIVTMARSLGVTENIPATDYDIYLVDNSDIAD